MIGTILASGSMYCRNGTSTSMECSYLWTSGMSGTERDSFEHIPSWTGHGPKGVRNGSEQSVFTGHMP